ncbi:bifunctional 2',3'-cyclic-nucleotide 2'-phosphodiesterase/3'-nucleotidase [Skermanella rosea]|uniref:bifunctional 2',3'-cyclic-nucleotide 2'-phosphodiesterase/3'-nucleotidase n=1 Tax=Skermanella rosea TaxID=1817965 RepID=UPI001933A07B|nr:bifunctional 2',3'-cyclic-nucleotide 2'-phosphodiesterase/3'-nucleotidase [Skermanella rosea]UEM02037.1 bifunctional 2',3'-cyclic-nucleotide 2'-phosphodiesterase/3'-nucleotidase [Skermanella rosea]
MDRRSFLSALALGAATCLTATCFATGALADATVRLRLLGTTDLHVNVLPYNYYSDKEDVTVGLARTATLIAKARDEAQNSLLLDNADAIQGNPLGDFVARERGLRRGDVHPVYKAMNLLKYDAGTVGNHEFNYGLDFLGDALAGANFPIVAANVERAGDGKPYFKPYEILTRQVVDESGQAHALKIGVIGFVTPQITTWDKAALEGKVVTTDIVEAARKYVPELRAKGADIVVALSHSGLSAEPRVGGEENATWYLAGVQGIDAILTGHQHKVFPGPDFAGLPDTDMAKGKVRGVPVVMPGFWGSHLGLIDLTLKEEGGKWSVADAVSSVRPIWETRDKRKVALVESDPAIVEALKADHEATLAYVRQPIGETTAPINSYFALVQDDPSVQIVTNAQVWYAKRMLAGTEYEGLPVLSAGAPFKAGGRGGPDYYTDIPAGRIAIRNAADLYLYPNTLRAVVMTGAQVRQWLEMSAGAFNRIDPAQAGEQPLLNPSFPSYNFDVIDGVTYRIDVSQPARYDGDGKLVAPASHRIRDLAFEGRPIDESRRFVVVTNNYRAGGGGKFPGLDGSNIILEAPDENRTALVNYIFDRRTIDPASEGNWSLSPIGGDAVVTFPSSPKAKEAIPAGSRISALGDAGDGFAKYRIDLSR